MKRQWNFLCVGSLLLIVFQAQIRKLLPDPTLYFKKIPLMNVLHAIVSASLLATTFAYAGDLTGPQKNAIRTATDYLKFRGFSRDGLINQLSSTYGDGYKVSDATIAVDSLNVNWHEQAVRSAKMHLNMRGFSCRGLINQLSSSAGDKYTESQATYGATQAGAC
jgi:hypothetical protein